METRNSKAKVAVGTLFFFSPVDGGPCAVVEVSPDIHICGFCKQQYNNYEVFLAHKKNGCSLPSHASASSAPASLTDSNSGFVIEDSYQVCVMKGVKKSLTKSQKAPSKKLKPALASKRHSCCFSGCNFKTQYGQKDMERHLKTHTGEKPFECELCHKRFSRRDKLNMHSRSHTGERPHKCKHCSYAAADSSSLKKHLRIHYDERPFKCQICPYASRNSSQLTVHLRSHTGDAPFQCQQCDAKFKINSDLKRHLRIHSGEKPYKCDFCDYCCAMKGNLKSHTRIKHGTENLYQCEQCDYKSASRLALRQHARQHLPSRPFQCSKCSYSCSGKGALRVHERIHSEERPFRCDLCSFASKRLSYLISHREQCHPDKAAKGGVRMARRKGPNSPNPACSRYRAKLDAARVFHCDLCDASFVREDSLRSHKKQHRDAQKAPQVPGSPDAVALLPVTVAQSEVPFPSYGNAQIKILVPQPLMQHGSLIAADEDGSGKTKMVFLDAESQDEVVSPVIQQVNLVAAVQRSTVGTEPQAVLLTNLSSDSSPAPQEPSSSRQTLITYSSDLDGVCTFIPDGGAELRVVAKRSSLLPPADVAASQAAGAGQEAALVVGGQNVVIQSVPLIVCAQPQQGAVEQLTPHGLYAEANGAGSSPQ
ncbi:PREDICTED: zinc finger protein 64 [Cyprinodon variegatus]|nr:PREDICTED: zinc finger protein 64 [Cyprinodon variegatus]